MIAETRYRIESEGNGARVTLIRITDGRSVFLQDEDAVQFMADADATNDRYTDDDLCDEYFQDLP